MEKRTCAGGCGEEIPADNKSGYKWGHKNGCPASEVNPRPSNLEAIEAVDDTASWTTIELHETHLDRIWNMLPLAEKSLAIATALAADRNP